jgi:putative transposase
VLPLLYLHGLSSLDFVPALEHFFGAAAGLSASVVTRLTTQWQAERAGFLARDRSDRDYVYCWADGIHFNLRLESGRLCCLVLVGVRADGTKELVAVADGQRESGDDWAELLRDLRRRGMGAPVVMVGDGALGLWRALGEVFPATREQRCWVHKVRNVLGALPKSVQAGARRALNEILQAEDRAHAERAIQGFAADYGAKWPKAVAKVVDDAEALLCFFDFPAEHWLHLRTGAGQNQGDQGAGQQGRRAGDGVQAAGGGRAAVAGGQRAAPGRPGARGRQVREGQAGRAIQGGARRGDPRGRRVIMRDRRS